MLRSSTASESSERVGPAIPHRSAPDVLLRHQTTSVTQRSTPPGSLRPSGKGQRIAASLNLPGQTRRNAAGNVIASEVLSRERLIGIRLADTTRHSEGKDCTCLVALQANSAETSATVMCSHGIPGISSPFPSFVRSPVTGAWDFQTQLGEIRTLSPVQ